MLKAIRILKHSNYFTTIHRGIWSHVQPVALDAIKGLTQEFHKDPHPNKILLGEGVYRDNEGKPVVLPSVRNAEKIIFEANLDHEYAPVSGIPAFCQVARAFAFGSDSSAVRDQKIATIQTISGTGALRLAAEFLKKFTPENTVVYLPNPSWVNHKPVFAAAGFSKIEQYRYFDKKTNGMDVQGCLEDLKQAPAKSIILLHACAHNPTGVDPTLDTWKKISQVCKEKEHIVFFDSAYQGFATGDPETDAQSFRMFVEDGHLPLVCQSFSKNFGLYGERAGTLNVVCSSKKEAENVLSQLSVLARRLYSNPPLYGARIVSTVFNNAELTNQWKKDVKTMADRIKTMRQSLVDELIKAGSKKSWKHITDQIGMFAYTGLTPEQVETLKVKHHIYMTKDGRISISGLNTGNVATVAQAIADVTK